MGTVVSRIRRRHDGMVIHSGHTNTGERGMNEREAS